MRNPGWMVLLLLFCTPVTADYSTGPGNAVSADADASQGPFFIDAQPPTLYSTPAIPYADTSPKNFVLIAGPHIFHDSQLPTVGDAKVRVYSRSYNPQLGVYVDQEVRDPVCIMTCLKAPAPATP